MILKGRIYRFYEFLMKNIFILKIVFGQVLWWDLIKSGLPVGFLFVHVWHWAFFKHVDDVH
jgi:hypothetical protein